MFAMRFGCLLPVLCAACFPTPAAQLPTGPTIHLSNDSGTHYAPGSDLTLDACKGENVSDANITLTLLDGATWTAGKQGCAIDLDGAHARVDLSKAVLDTS